MEGYCTDREDFRVFKLTRMAHINISEERFEKRAYSPRDHGREGWIKDRLFNIEVEFNKKVYESISERCGEDNIERIDAETFKATMPITDDEYSYNILLGYGSNLKCLSPQFVIDKVKETAQSVLDQYK